MARKLNMTSKDVGLKYGFRSGLEEEVANYLKSKDVNFKFEERPLAFIEPAKKRKYTPDFFVYDKSGELRMIIETKGRFTLEDRKKMVLFKQQYPDLDIRILFNNYKAKISKASKTTYGEWCEKNGFKYGLFSSKRGYYQYLDRWISELKEGE